MVIVASACVSAMHGLGDNIYLRPFVRSLVRRHATVYVRTPWPQLYADLGVHLLPADSPFRTQRKNEERGWAWSPEPGGGAKLYLPRYLPRDLEAGLSISETLEAGISLQGDKLWMDLPARLARPPVIDARGRPLAVVRPNTVRAEWANPARNPDPVALARVVEALGATHHVISVADVDDENEWLAGEPPPAHLQLHRGELTPFEVIELMRRADVIVGGVGWIVPASVALRVPTFIVGGGHGAHNAPARLLDPRLNATWIGFCRPDRPCECFDREHECDKLITDPVGQFRAWAQPRGILP